MAAVRRLFERLIEAAPKERRELADALESDPSIASEALELARLDDGLDVQVDAEESARAPSAISLNAEALLLPGQRIGPHFELVEPLSAGGTADVWRADSQGGRSVAVKIARQDGNAEARAAARSRLRAEAACLGELRIRGVVARVDFIEGPPPGRPLPGARQGPPPRRRCRRAAPWGDRTLRSGPGPRGAPRRRLVPRGPEARQRAVRPRGHGDTHRFWFGAAYRQPGRGASRGGRIDGGVGPTRVRDRVSRRDEGLRQRRRLQRRADGPSDPPSGHDPPPSPAACGRPSSRARARRVQRSRRAPAGREGAPRGP